VDIQAVFNQINRSQSPTRLIDCRHMFALKAIPCLAMILAFFLAYELFMIAKSLVWYMGNLLL